MRPGSAANAATIEQASTLGRRILDELAAIYDYRDAATVRTYLAANADLAGLLRELPDRASSYLPVVGRPVLEIVQDPDDAKDEGRLFALIPVRLDPSDALARLDRMRRDWWLDAYRRAGGRLNVDVEFR